MADKRLWKDLVVARLRATRWVSEWVSLRKHRRAREISERARKKNSSSPTATLLRWRSIIPCLSPALDELWRENRVSVNRLVEHGLFSYSLDRVSRSRRHCMEYMWVLFCRIAVENFFVDSKSFPLEAIGIWKEILTDRTGSESSKFFWQPEMASLPSPHWFKSEANSALDQ